MTEKKKRGRPRKIKLDKDIVANIEPVEAQYFDAEKMGKIDAEYAANADKSIGKMQRDAKNAVKEAHREHDYNPFDNPIFKAKMKITEQNAKK